MTTNSDGDSSSPWASIYTPLQRNRFSIRVLEILPCNTEDDTLKCVLIPAQLGPDLRYAALSYVWGDPKVTKNIIVNDVVLPVTINLESALRQFRKTGLPAEEGTAKITKLWADAICINQNDILERNHQVTLMASIYSDAASVLSWLGPPNEERHDLAFQTITRLKTAVSTAYHNLEECQENIETAKRLGVECLVKVIESFNMNQENPHPSRALASLEHNAYWTRMWIIQEMALAKSGTTHWFICGDETITYDVLESFGTFLNMYQGSRPANNDLPDNLKNAWNFLATGALVKVPIWGAPYFTRFSAQTSFLNGRLVECIIMSAIDAYATNPRDFVYAVTSVAANTVEPDYRKEVRDVYLDAVLSDGISRCAAHCLGVSGIGNNYGNDYNLPSWLPDFSKIKTMNGYPTHGLGSLFGAIDLHTAELLPNNVLRVHGANYDRVNLIKPLHTNFVPIEPTLGNSPQKFLLQLCIDYLVEFRGFHMRRSDPSWYFDSKPLETLMDVMRGGFSDYFSIPGLPEKRFPIGAVSALRHFTDCAAFTEEEKRTALSRLGLAVDKSLPLFLMCGLLGNDTLQVIAHMNGILEYEGLTTWTSLAVEATYAASRTLFQTDQGYLGIGPPNLQSGDLVCMLDQCERPSLLRKNGSHLEHVGSCYVAELGGRKAYEKFENGEVQIEIFEIH
ncbi:hypothetical protein ABKA04_008933 [Annulohypoxylon sp. FPYF3050]